MPRILMNAQLYADEDFRCEVRQKQGKYDLMSQQALADVTGIPRPTLRKRLLQLETMNVGELRKLVKVLIPDPVIMLRVLGYDMKDIRRALGEAAGAEKKNGDACQRRRQSPIEWR